MNYGDDQMTTETIEKIEKYIKNALFGILAILVYFILPKMEGIFFEIFNVSTTNLSINIRILYSTIFDILIIAIIMLIFNQSLKKEYKDFKKNHDKYYKDYFKYYLIGLVIMMFSNVIISIISQGGKAGNQESINELFSISPLYVYFASVIFAPIVEELVFRKAIYNIIPNKFLFILASGLIFGSLHVIGNIEVWYDFLYIIPYSTPGIIFAYILYKTDNIFVSMGLHFMHNGILIALQFFILLFG